LSHCGLTELHSMHAFAHLATVNLAHNELSSLCGLEGLLSCECLDLSHNKLQTVNLDGLRGSRWLACPAAPPSPCLPGLQVKRCWGCFALGAGLPKLRVVKLSHNPWRATEEDATRLRQEWPALHVEFGEES
jgi:hypothetical protein